MGTAECRSAIDQLSTYITNPTIGRAAIEVALSHVHGCPDCTRRIGYLVRALHSRTIDRLDCTECQDRLPGYHHAVAAGQATVARWRAVALHLSLCPDCSAAYADLADLADLAEGRSGTEPLVYPTPDLSFLKPPLSLRDRIIAFSEELLRSLIVPSGPAFAPSGLKSLKSLANLRPYALVGEVPDQDVTITIEPVRGDPAHCTITVNVDIPSRRGWPNLGGTRIKLRRGDIEIATSVTDAFGNVVFEPVAVDDLARLVFAIERSASERSKVSPTRGRRSK